MKNFEIKSVNTAADTDTQIDNTGTPVTTVGPKWTDVTVRLYSEFDWTRPGDTNALFKKLRSAGELNDE